MAEAVLIRVFSGVVTVIFTPRTAWERDEWAFNYEIVSNSSPRRIGSSLTNLRRRSRAIRVCLIIKALKLLQARTPLLRQPTDHCLASVVPKRKPCQCALLGRLKQIIHLVVIYLVVAQRDLHGSLSVAILFHLPTPSVNAAQESGNDTSVRETFTAAHRVCLAGSSNTVGEESNVKTIEEVLDRWRDYLKDSG